MVEECTYYYSYVRERKLGIPITSIFFEVAKDQRYAMLGAAEHSPTISTRAKLCNIRLRF